MIARENARKIVVTCVHLEVVLVTLRAVCFAEVAEHSPVLALFDALSRSATFTPCPRGKLTG